MTCFPNPPTRGYLKFAALPWRIKRRGAILSISGLYRQPRRGLAPPRLEQTAVIIAANILVRSGTEHQVIIRFGLSVMHHAPS